MNNLGNRMKRILQYIIVNFIFLLASFYIVFGFQFESAGLEFIKLVSMTILIFVVLGKHISWLVNGHWRGRGNCQNNTYLK